MTTKGYFKATKMIIGNWTQEEVFSGKRVIDYYNYPILTADASVTKLITEEDAKTGTYKIKGKWTNELKTGGKIIVRKGDKTLDTIDYALNQEAGTWSVTIPKDILIPGKNIFDISMETKSNENYESLVIKENVTIEVLKHVNVKYFAINEDKSEVEIKKEELDDSPTFLDVEMNKEHVLKPKEMLAIQKYVLNIEKSGANEQKEIKTLITIETDQIKVYYNYNTIPLTIRYHNIDTKNKIFASVSESKRRVDRLVKDAVAGTPLIKVFTKEDKEAEGYDFHSLVDQSGDKISDDAVVPSKSAIYTVYFTSKYQIDAPESIDFGQMIIPENDQLQYPINPYEVGVINTVENEAGTFGSWDLVASFLGFYSGTVKLNADLKYADKTIKENTPILKSKTNAENPKSSTALTNDAEGLHLVVGGVNNLLGKYKGTIQWDL